MQPRGAEAALDGPAGDTDPNVAYTWGYGLSGSAATHARLEKVTLPGGREIYYNYEDANAFMSLGRVANIADGSSGGRTKYVAYKYLGASMVVDADHPAVPNGLRLTYASVTSGDYGGFDRFGRVVWQRWLRTGGDTAADRHFYGYDRAGNRKWRAERSNASDATGKRDEAYVYDGLDRLIGAKRGILPSGAYQAPYPGDVTLDGAVDGFDNTVLMLNWLGSGKIWTQADFNGDGSVDGFDNTILGDNWQATPTEDLARSWSWSLTPTGNWSAHKQDNNGDGDPNDAGDVNQTRTHDNANEITSMSGVALAPLYDQAGNNVRGPRPADPNANNAAHFRYDAWNRLATIHLDDGSASGTLDANDTLLATYRYDGLNRRVMKAVAVDGNSVTDYMYHNENWQIVEIRRGVNQTPTAAAYKQFVWDIRYIDAPVCRWWDDDANSATAAKLHYFTNDGNFNTTALVDANSGGVVERYQYDPYGKPTFLDANWAPRSSSSYDNDVLFCGYWYDPETGLYHVRERYYDPITGTWKTRDKIVYPDGMNLYEYVISGPTGRIDPWGAEWEKVSGSVGEHLWKATGTEYLTGLITKLNASSGFTNTRYSKACIRPMPDLVDDESVRDEMKKKWAQGLPADCGIYDVKNLVDALPVGNDVFVDVAGDPGAQTERRWKDGKIIWKKTPGGLVGVQQPGGFKDVTVAPGGAVDRLTYFILGSIGGALSFPRFSTDAAMFIKQQAGGGAFPLANLIVVGHGDPTLDSLGPRGGRGVFSVRDLERVVGTWPSYDDAVERRNLPPICWFRHDATVKLVGCSTGPRAATSWATKILRRGAYVWGTDAPLYADYWKDQDDTVGGYTAFFEGGPVHRTPAALWTSTHWQKPEGQN